MTNCDYSAHAEASSDVATPASDSAAIDALIATILHHEGGYAADPADPGGATNHGISLRYARRVGLDLDGDGTVEADDIRLVTPQTAAALYRADFYRTPGFDRLPPPIQPVLVDWAVNSGPPRAIMGLQRVLNEAGQAGAIAPPLLDEDGVIGPRTRRAAAAAQAALGALLVNALVDERLAFYHRLVVARPDSARFLRGWQRRATHFRIREA